MSQSSRDKNLYIPPAVGDGSNRSTVSDQLLPGMPGKAKSIDAEYDMQGNPVKASLSSLGGGGMAMMTHYDANPNNLSPAELEEVDEEAQVYVSVEYGQVSDLDETKREVAFYHVDVDDGGDSRRCFDYFTYTQLSKLITGKDAKIISPRTFAIYCFAAIGTVGAAPLSYKAGIEVAGENIYGVTLGLTFAAFSYPAFIVLVSAVIKKMYRNYKAVKTSKAPIDLAELQDSSGAIKRSASSAPEGKLSVWFENFVVVLLSLSAAVQFASATEAALSGKQESFVRSRDPEALPAFLISFFFAYVAMVAVNFAGNVKTKMRLDKYWYDYLHPETAAQRKKIKQYLRNFKVAVLGARTRDLADWTESCLGLKVEEEGRANAADPVNTAGVAPADSKKFVATEVIRCAVSLFAEEAQVEQVRKSPCGKIAGLLGALVGAAAGYAYYAMSYQAIERYGGKEAAKSGWTFGFALFSCAGHAMITAIPLEMWAMAAYHRCTNKNYRSSYSSTRVSWRERAAWAAAIYGGSATIPILYLTYRFIEKSGVNPWFKLFLIPIFLGPWALRTESLKQELNGCINFDYEPTLTAKKLKRDRLQAMIDGTLELVEYAKAESITGFFVPLKEGADKVAQREEEVSTPGSTGSTNSRTALNT
jgi:hypothetical protein